MEDLTQGSIVRHLLKTTSFMLVTMLFQTLYFLIDLYWVGRLGKEAIAGVAIAGNLMFVVLAITQMLGVGTTALISHAAGRKDRDRAQLVFNESLVLSVLIGGAFLLLALALRRAYVGALSADAPTAARASEYLAWFVPAMALQFGMVTMGAALRGTGNFKPGMVVQQAGFMPIVALGFAVAPVAGQNFGAREADRVRETFRHAALMAAGIMAVFTVVCHLVPAAMIRLFSSDAQVIAVGSDYLRIISWTFVASGIIFVNASMFQAMGNTIPPLIASFARLVLVGVPIFAVAQLPGFNLRWIWYLSVASVAAQLAINLVLLKREFRVRLSFA